MKYTVIIFFALILALTISCSTQKNNNNEVHDEMPGMIMLSENDRSLANIKSEMAVVKNISEITTLVGKTAIDDRKVDVLTSRVAGRLDELLVKNPGEYVNKGQAVYAIYSEELLSDENDYLLALDQYEMAVTQKAIAAELVTAARKKLLRWTLSENQIKELEQTKKTTSLIKFYSPYSGYTIELLVREGEYVDIGSPLLKLSDLNTVWIETQVYSDEVRYLKQNLSMQLEFETYPNETLIGQIAFDNPTLEADQKINLVRLQVQNKNHKIKPGMMAYIYLRRSEKRTLVIPKSALLMESTVSVWVEDDEGMFEQRMVTTGIENKEEVEILSGLQPGDKVVVSGAFLLKSENVIRQGGGNMGGMKM